MARTYAVRIGDTSPPPDPTSPAPVALVAADGETITAGGTSQSNFTGAGFYTRNGLTYARDWSGPNPLGGTFNGFDDPTFVPIAPWLMDFTDPAMYARLADLGINGMLPAYSTIDSADAVAHGMWMVATAQAYPPGTVPTSGDSAVLGVSTGEEPWDDSTFAAIVDSAATWLANPQDGPGRLHLFNFADHILDPYLFFATTTQAQAVRASDPDPPTVRRQWTTSDMYWFAGATGGSNSARFKLPFRMYQHLTAEATTDEALRGCHYGSMLDAIRSAYVQPSGPIGIWVENGAPFNEPETHEITPAEMAWAVWSILVHGGRSIHWFNHTFRSGDPSGGSINNFGSNYYGGPGVPGTGVYAKAKELNRRALTIAPAINSPRDGYFVWGTTAAISQPGFLTDVTSTHPRAAYAGVEACAKWVPSEGKHYVFSTTRESGAATNVPATYHLVDQGQTQATPVFGGAPIPIQRDGLPSGQCQFSDTFASARDYRCWRID